MKSLKALVLGTTVALGVAGFAGTNASAKNAYTVEKGDTLAKISQKFAGDFSLVQNIASANGITNINLIFEGTTLTIPEKGTAVQVAPKPVQQPVQQPVQKVAYQAPQPKQVAQKAPVQQTTNKVTTYKATTTQKAAPKKVAATPTSNSSAKAWIAMKESTNNYNAVSASGTYVGKYQLTRSYLNGDTSPANQERVAEKYVKERYGSWENAKAFHLKNGWY